MLFTHALMGSNPIQVTIHAGVSSAGIERLPYKQKVGGSNPSHPTM